MKKVILVIFCTAILMSGCSSNTADTVSNDVQQVNVSYDQMNNEGIGWGFVRKKGAPPEIPNSQKEVLRKYDCYYIDENAPKTLYLTFDEGYENGYTSKIFDGGHIVGNHTVNHPNLPKQSVETEQKELSDLNKMCEEMYGVSMKYMRPPEGEYSERVLAVAKDMGYRTILWSFAYKDWDINMQQGADYAFNQVTPYLHDGAVLLLHAVSSDNANALEDIINYAKNEGYTFKSLDELQ